MSPTYLVDTNILSEPTRVTPNPSVVRLLEARRHLICTAALVFNEILFGFLRLPPSAKQRKATFYLSEVLEGLIPILPYDQEAARWHAIQRARLERIGRRPPYIDGQIAAIATVNELILVTDNLSDFLDFEDLVLENWAD